MLKNLFDLARGIGPIPVEHDEDERHDEDEAPDPPAVLVVRPDGWLEGPGVHHDTSPKWSRSVRLERQGPDAVVQHSTATAWGTMPALLNAIRRKGGRDASWHACVDEFGDLWQSISFRRAAWHAGSASAAKAEIDGKLVPLNLCSIGIEVINAGEVRKVGGVWRAWPFAGNDDRGPGPEIPDTQVVTLGPRHYHGYTSAQRMTCRRLWDAIRAAYPRVTRSVTLVHPDGKRDTMRGDVIGHVDVDPRRKSDPYPSWYRPATATI